MSQLFVTIGIITYNRKDLLKESLRSALDQKTSVPFEILIIDDGSTDGTEEMLATLFKDSRIRYLKLKQNVGRPVARNIGIKNMLGNCLIWLDDDDALPDGALDSQVKCLQKNPEVDVVYGIILNVM